MKATGVRRLVRPMSLADIPQVEEIEREAFPSSWPPSAFQHELRHNRIARYLVAVEELGQDEEVPPPPAVGLGRVLVGLRRALSGEDTPRERVLGYLGMWLPADEAHIIAIAVRSAYRRQGLGELLLMAGLELARREGRTLATLECRVSNGPAQALYYKYGFRQVGLRPRYYSDNLEDAYVMALDGLHTPAVARRLEELKALYRQRRGEAHILMDL
ncbi:MAG TPA: ribosomal protein S18-alanine N-acetyltransferase [Dehalococcoidia bacterium]|nr:ribosomal protein S18-alanine N-acetyltransferase [Dehalococcoidia bacterium]